MPIIKTQLKRNLFWNTLGTGLNAIYSTIIIIIITRFSSDGISLSGQFSYAFYISGLFSTIGYYGGRIYHISDISSEYTDDDYISVRYLASIIMLFVTIVFCIFNSYSFEKSLLIIILVGFRVFESISDGLYGILQKNDDLEHVGKSMILRSIISSLLFIIIFLKTNNVLIASFSFIIVFFANMCLYDKSFVHKIECLTPKISKKTVKLMKTCFPTFVLAFYSLLLLNISRYFVDLRLADSDQGYFGIIILPASIMVLVIQFIIQPFLKSLVYNYHNNFRKYQNEKRKIIIYVMLISLVVVIVCYFFGVPVFNALYGYDFSDYKVAIIISVIAGTFNGLVGIISNLMTISRKINIQIYMYSIITILSIIYSYFTIYSLSAAINSYLFIMIISLTIFTLTDLSVNRKGEIVKIK